MFFGRSKKKVLIVDDEASTRGMLAMLLGDQDYEILEADAGDTAVQMARDNAPDLIILDVMMPKLSGFEVLQILRADAKTKTTPIVMCTALNTLDDVERCLGAGANDYIQKPFDLKNVLAKVQKLLGSGC